MSLLDFSNMQPADYEKLANVKLGFFNRIVFKRVVKKLRDQIAADETISNKLLRAFRPAGIDDRNFHAGGFILGASFLTLGILVAYLINNDHKKARRKWAWLGMASILDVVLLLYTAFAKK